MAVVGLKLGRHSVQAALWSENLGRAVEAHLPGLEVESSWTPVLARDRSGKLSWGEDLWTHLHAWEPLEESLPERLLAAAPAEVTALQLLLARTLWPEVGALAEKELRAARGDRLGLALTASPSEALRERFARSLAETVGLAWFGSAAAAAVAATAPEWEEAGGWVLHAHLGGEAARVSVWEVSRAGDRFRLEERSAVEEREAGLEALLDRVYQRLIGPWGLLRIEAAGSPAEAELIRRVRLDVLRRLAEGRVGWDTAWQYEAGPDFRHLAQWTHPGPARFPAEQLAALLREGQERVSTAAARALAGAGVSPEQILRVVATGRGASEDYFQPALQHRFGRKRCPRRRDAEMLPALGAATIACDPDRWRIAAARPVVRATGEPARPETSPAPASTASRPSPVEEGRSDPDGKGVGIGLAIGTDKTSVAWKEHGRPGMPESVPLQGRPVISSTVAVERQAADARFWGPAAERLRGDLERFAVIPDLPSHYGTGVRFVLTRGKRSGSSASLTPEELFSGFATEIVAEAERAIRRAGAEGEPLVALAPPAPWPEHVAQEARRELRMATGRRVRLVHPGLAALLSSFPAKTEDCAAVLLVDGDGYSAARLEPCSGDPLGWRVAAQSRTGGYAARFCAEVLARFLTDELNGRFARSYRYAGLIAAQAGSEERGLGEALREAGDELAERLTRSPKGAVRLELRLPGGGTALFEATATREQWDGWAGKRVRETVGKVLGEVLVEPYPRRLVLAGSGTAMPLFLRAAGDFCRTLGIAVELHPQPEQGVALGAALAAAAWAAERDRAGAAPVAILAGSELGSILEEVRARFDGAGVRAEVVQPGADEGAPRAVVFATAGGPPDELLRQELEWILRNGIPVLPLRVGSATLTPGPPLDSLSADGREEVDRLARTLKRLLAP